MDTKSKGQRTCIGAGHIVAASRTACIQLLEFVICITKLMHKVVITAVDFDMYPGRMAVAYLLFLFFFFVCIVANLIKVL